MYYLIMFKQNNIDSIPDAHPEALGILFLQEKRIASIIPINVDRIGHTSDT